MKIKINQAGWEGFTGEFGGIQFKDGESVDDVPDRIARRLSNIVAIELLDGTNPSDSQRLIDMRGIDMGEAMGAEQAANKLITHLMAPKRWERAELEEIADAKGIAGIREISDPMGLKSNAVAKLIDLILQTQNGGEVSIEGLYGSNVQPPTFVIDGKTVQLGTVVADAFKATGMTASEWNDMPAEFRELHIAKQVAALRGE